MQTEIPKWVLYFSGTRPGCSSSVNWSILGFWQWRTADTKLRMDLFKPRLDMYEALQALISRSTNGNERSPNFLDETHQSLRGLEFVVGADLVLYCREIQDKCWDLVRKERQFPNLPEPRRKNVQEKITELQDYLTKQHKILEEKFRPYLDLSNVKVPRAPT